jgi:adenylosuccinate lyase
MPRHETDEAQMIDRYSRNEIARIWDLENKFRIWLDIELAVCQIYAEKGMIPKEDLAVIKEKAAFDVDRNQDIESQVHHHVIASSLR